jgi:hypothetical protein
MREFLDANHHLMSRAVKVALILAGGLIVAAILNGGIYQIAATGTGVEAIAYRLNRFTGEITAVVQWRYITIRPALPWGAPSPNATPTPS